MKTITKCGEYVAHNGLIGRVVCVDKAGTYPVVVVWPNGNVTTHAADGRFALGCDQAYDLIREHREPQKFEFEGKAVNGHCIVAGSGMQYSVGLPLASTTAGTRYRVTIEEIMEN